jgi:hypothetical protein
MEQDNREIFKADVPPPGAGELEYFRFFADLKTNNLPEIPKQSMHKIHYVDSYSGLLYYYQESIMFYFFVMDLRRNNKPVFDALVNDLGLRETALIGYINAVKKMKKGEKVDFFLRPVPWLILCNVSWYMGFESVSHFLRVLCDLYSKVLEEVIKGYRRGYNGRFYHLRDTEAGNRPKPRKD